jgi:lysine 2,3-aminomutase
MFKHYTLFYDKRRKSEQFKNDILNENAWLSNILNTSTGFSDFIKKLASWLDEQLPANSVIHTFRHNNKFNSLIELSNKEIGLIRLLDYIEFNGLAINDLNLKAKLISSSPLEHLFAYLKYNQKVKLDFAIDFLYLFRQINGKADYNQPSKEQILLWMDKHASGLDIEQIELYEFNKKRIIKILIEKIDHKEITLPKYAWPDETTEEQKLKLLNSWWNDKTFHLQFAARNPKLLNEYLNYSLDSFTMETLNKAAEKGIPFFITLHYLCLLNTNSSKIDLTIRQYVLYSRELIEEFGDIMAWEKEDIVELGKPNAAGWLLPSHDSVHRRYPEVAILIPATMGRACAGLCVSCQRMYDFQRGHLNFNLDKLSPDDTWPKRLLRYLDYFENDAQLRDILITGGDAFMSSDDSLRGILEAVYEMAKRKKEANLNRVEGEKYAEILRVRLGTRIFAYLPQRITSVLIDILRNFKEKASEIGIKQFVVQTHFESALEITPIAKNAINQLSAAGWLVTNQLVLTSAGSRRGHTAKLRQVLNDIGVIPYYTFTIKGFRENIVNFATNARAVQELSEEKYIGLVSDEVNAKIALLSEDTRKISSQLNEIRKEAGIPFIATDKTVLNLPGVGKSLNFRVIGLTDDGRRILRFNHDGNRKHSPIIEKMKTVDVIESKSIYSFLIQLQQFGEDIREYESIWNYSLAWNEGRAKIFESPEYPFKITNEFTNLQID